MFISKALVPEYLRGGTFYKELNANTVEVPESSFKPDLAIESAADLSHAMQTLRFWKVDKVPEEVVKHVLKHVEKPQLHPLAMDFPEYMNFFVDMFKLKGSQPTMIVLQAIAMGLGVEVVKFLHESMNCGLNPECWVEAACRDDAANLNYLADKNVSENREKISAEAAMHGSIN